MKNIVIIGAGDLGKEVVWLIEEINRLEPTYLIMGFLDDDTVKMQTIAHGYKVMGKIDELKALDSKTPLCAVVAIQDGGVRRRIVESNKDFGKWESIVHPATIVAPSSRLGIGSIVFPHVMVSVDTTLGNFNIYHINSTVCKGCKIGDYVSVMCGASILEHTEVGDECFLAAGSCIYPHKKLGRKVNVAIEATVSKDCLDGAKIREKGSWLF